MLKRQAYAIWQGTGKDGGGSLTSPSGVLKETPYSFHSRFEDGTGTNPEELLAAAHAGCFNMALSFGLTAAGFTPEKLTTTATVVMEQKGVHWTVTGINLELQAQVPGIDLTQLQTLAEGVKTGCPVSKLFNAPISLSIQLNK